MPHVAFVPLTGFRVREQAMLDLGMTLPALGLLTLAGLTPEPWTCTYHATAAVDERSIDALTETRPDLVAVSALTASALEAYRLGDELKRRGVRCVLGGLHATACPEEAQQHFDAVVIGEGEPVWPRVLEDAGRGDLQLCDSSHPISARTARAGT